MSSQGSEVESANSSPQVAGQALALEAPDWRAHVLVLCRLVIGAAFLYYSFQKLADLPSFLKGIRGYELVMLDPPYLINTIAVFTPFLEVLLGFAAVFGLWLRGVFTLSLGMLLFFTLMIVNRALGDAASEGISLCSVAFDCGCGNGEVNACGKTALNGGLILASAVGLYCSMKVKKQKPAA